MSHPKQLQAQSSSLSVLRNKEAVAAVVLDTTQDAEATTYPQPSEKCSLSSASLWHGDVETMLELDVLPHKGHDLQTYARMQILPGPLGLPPGTPALSASGATDKASMLRQALANVKEDTAKMTGPTITRDQSTKAHPPSYVTPFDLLSPDLSGSDEGSISSTCAAFRTFGHVADSGVGRKHQLHRIPTRRLAPLLMTHDLPSRHGECRPQEALPTGAKVKSQHGRSRPPRYTQWRPPEVPWTVRLNKTRRRPRRPLRQSQCRPPEAFPAATNPRSRGRE
ncbi:hypothetical protein HPB50_029130 [Hyalomma asiaticum]|nr:hypothetical protein HPB50_029130 [Hyalomma asiaticum]